MNAKLSFADIVDLFVAKTGQTKKEAESFLRELLEVMASKMNEDGILKIRDFGTFKVVEVESRESVDVNTGAKILIASHRKISFTPDKTLKDLVNKPFSLFEPELLNDGVNFEQSASDKAAEEEEGEENEVDAEQAEEENAHTPNLISTTLADLTFDSNSNTDLMQNGDPIEDLPEESASPKENKSDVLPPASLVEASPLIGTAAGEAVAANANDEPGPIKLEDNPAKGHKKTWIMASAIFVVLLFAAVAFYFFYVMDNNNLSKPLQATAAKSADSLTRVASKPQAVEQEDSLARKATEQRIADSLKISVDKADKEAEKVPAKPDAPTVSKATRDVVSEGATFRTLALKHYGSKEFWVYIYQANKAKIPHPNMLRYGLSVTIPDAKSLGIDAKDPASIKRAKALSDKVLNEIN